jgi:hypothetical protein
VSSNGFIQSIKKSSELTLRAEIRAHYNPTPNLPSDYVGKVRNLSYLEQWEVHNEQYWYHLKLEDQSLLFFEKDSFKYIASPYETLDNFDEYELRIRQELYDEGLQQEEIEEYIEDIDTQYQYYLETESKYGSYTPIRVDTHPHQYNKINHPVTHLHMGHGNESRLPIKKLMTPFSFTGFVLSTFYPRQWNKLRTENMLTDQEYKELNENLPLVPHQNTNHWCPVEEENRFYLV